MIRNANKKDIKNIMIVVKSAQTFLKEEGVDQWQNNYPNEEVLEKDIENNNLYVYELNQQIIGFCAIIFGIDVTYNKIYEGKWLNEKNNYVTIHRIATLKEYHKQHIAGEFLEFAKELAIKKNVDSIRIDTHKDNKAMNNFLNKNKFKKCGIIYLLDGNVRLAYELIIKKTL